MYVVRVIIMYTLPLVSLFIIISLAHTPKWRDNVLTTTDHIHTKHTSNTKEIKLIYSPNV